MAKLIAAALRLISRARTTPDERGWERQAGSARTVMRYLTRLFALRFLLIVTSLTALAEILDLFANADKVLTAEGAEGLGDMARYAVLRLPRIASDLIPFSVLLAILLTLAGMVRHNELTSIKAAGISQLQLILAFMPAAAAIAVTQFAVNDWLVPRTEITLRDWAVGAYAKKTRSSGVDRAWVRERSTIIRIGRADRDGDGITEVTIYHRDANGNLIERIEAKSAKYRNGAWTLYDVVRSTVGGAKIHLAQMPWAGKLQPAQFALMMANPAELTFLELRNLVSRLSRTNSPTYLYETGLHQKIASPLGAILMILLVVPMAQTFHREAGVAVMLVSGVAIGFIYFVLDSWSQTLGQAGLLPPILAAWGPVLALACLGGGLAFRHERYRQVSSEMDGGGQS